MRQPSPAGRSRGKCLLKPIRASGKEHAPALMLKCNITEKGNEISKHMQKACEICRKAFQKLAVYSNSLAVSFQTRSSFKNASSEPTLFSQRVSNPPQTPATCFHFTGTNPCSSQKQSCSLCESNKSKFNYFVLQSFTLPFTKASSDMKSCHWLG